MTESRQSFRAPVLDVQLAVISVGAERLIVKLLEESSGELSTLAQKRPDFPCDSSAELEYADGHCLWGKIKYIEPLAEGFRIGFQRCEMIVESNIDLRAALPVSVVKSVPVLAYAAVLLIGLGLGWLWTSGHALELYGQVSRTLRSR